MIYNLTGGYEMSGNMGYGGYPGGYSDPGYGSSVAGYGASGGTFSFYIHKIVIIWRYLYILLWICFSGSRQQILYHIIFCIMIMLAVGTQRVVTVTIQMYQYIYYINVYMLMYNYISI